MSLMTVLRSLNPPDASRGPTLAEIEQRLEVVCAQRANLDAQYGEEAFNAVSGVEGAQDRVNGISQQMAELDRNITTMTAALEVAKEREAERVRQIRIAGQKQRIESVQRILDRRLHYTEQLSEKLAEASRYFRLLMETTDKAGILLPPDAKVAANINPGAVRDQVAHELYRVASGPMTRIGVDQSRGFPGSKPPTLDMRDQPTAIEPIASHVAKGNEHAMALLKAGIAKGEGIAVTELNLPSTDETATSESVGASLEADDGVVSRTEAPSSEGKDLRTVVAIPGAMLDELHPAAPAAASFTPIVHPQPASVTPKPFRSALRKQH